MVTKAERDVDPALTGVVRSDSDRTPWLLGFVCLLISAFPASSVFPGPLKGNGSPARLLAFLLAGLVVLGILLGRRRREERAFSPGPAVLLCYFGLMLIALGAGLSHLDSPLAEAGKSRAVLSFIAPVGIGIYAATRVRTTRQLSFVLGCLAVGISYSCFIGLVQDVANLDLRLLLEPPGFVTNSTAAGRPQLATIVERLGAQRVSGTAGHPIEFAVLAASNVPIALYFMRFADRRSTRLLATLSLAASLLALPTGVSRSGVVALTAAMFLYVWSMKLRTLGIALAVGASAVLTQLAIAPVTINALWQTIIGSADDESVLSRVAAAARVSQTFRESPIFGIGPGGTDPEEYGYLDNQWLQALAQGGLVGLTAMATLVVGSAFGFAASLRMARTEKGRQAVYATGSAFAAILASSFTFDLFAFQQATLIFFVLIGLLWSTVRVASPTGAP